MIPFISGLLTALVFCMAWAPTNYRLEVRLGRWGRRWVKSKVQGRLCSFLESLAENLFPGLFQLLEAACIPWLVVPFLHLQDQQHCTYLITFLLSPLWLQPGKPQFWEHTWGFLRWSVAKTLNAGDLGSVLVRELDLSRCNWEFNCTTERSHVPQLRPRTSE